MVYGKTQVTFRLMTEETAIKWKIPCSTSAQTIQAGMMVYLDKTNAYIQPYPANTALSAGFLIGISMDDYSTTTGLDETQGSGFLTVVLGPHIAATSLTTTAAGTTPILGTMVVNPSTAGKLEIGAVTGNYTRVGHVLNTDGVFTTYFWVGV
jgi:hypothetical protein